MRIPPNQPRLRAVALGCWALSGWCIIYGGRLVINHTEAALLIISIELLALLGLAVGVAFWVLSTDRRAGITFDSKGLMLNLGNSSAFISWHNIESLGVTKHRSSLFTLGSQRQLGITLRDVQPYLQSYEARLPSARGALAHGVRLIGAALRPWRRLHAAPSAAQMAACRAQTGYDVLVPEALLGGATEAFVELAEMYRLHPSQRRTLEGLVWVQ
jgi:hypothetical protein